MDALTPKEERAMCGAIGLAVSGEHIATLVSILERFRPRPWVDPLTPAEREALVGALGTDGLPHRMTYGLLGALDRLTRRPEEAEHVCPQGVREWGDHAVAAWGVATTETNIPAEQRREAVRLLLAEAIQQPKALPPASPMPRPWVTAEEVQDWTPPPRVGDYARYFNALIQAEVQRRRDGMPRLLSFHPGDVIRLRDVDAALGTKGGEG